MGQTEVSKEPKASRKNAHPPVPGVSKVPKGAFEPFDTSISQENVFFQRGDPIADRLGAHTLEDGT
jgi:hypothetical protein